MTQRRPESLFKGIDPDRLPPLEEWQPPLSGAMDLCIARDGRWWHEGRPIERQSLVRLFATILRREADGEHYLVTPVEKWKIQVDDAAFLAVRLDIDGEGRDQRLDFTTNLDERAEAGPGRPIVVEYRAGSEEPAPYLAMRNGLRARLIRSVFLELAERVEPGRAGPSLAGPDEVDGAAVYGVWSRGAFSVLGPMED
jgi:uncharacterized protein